ncbi:MAG: ABC transporter ATP-binding protein [SAR86 cluster bacterium]|uniref:ABC transporter ATP-binding protein n=1 Tax=SAR86 cluster bacterium TaxID=2030880 RepID=A0A2A4X2G2_9GAMM|nr:MAG: ABC transporter ATP-binding protein [SAR86 cluster bacterium]
MSEKILVQLEGIEKTYKVGKLESTVLSDIDLTISEGEYVSICGPSGCGKSTLLSIIGLLNGANKGRYLFIGEDVMNMKSSQHARIRNRNIGFIFQAFNLSSEMTAAENVELPLTYRKEMSRKDRKVLVDEMLDKIGMTDFSQHFPSQLSGGQQQRIAIARALAGKPQIILADEPTGNLDSKAAAIVMDIFDKLNAEGTTICLVTHDPRSAQKAGRQVHLFDGRIVAPNEGLVEDASGDSDSDGETKLHVV